jgi:hypothetical protein
MRPTSIVGARPSPDRPLRQQELLRTELEKYVLIRDTLSAAATTAKGGR